MAHALSAPGMSSARRAGRGGRRKRSRADADADEELSDPGKEDDEDEEGGGGGHVRKRQRRTSGAAGAGGRSKREAIDEAHTLLLALLQAALEVGLTCEMCPAAPRLAAAAVERIPHQRALRLTTKEAAERFLASLSEEALCIGRDLVAWQAGRARLVLECGEGADRVDERVEEAIRSLHPATLRKMAGEALTRLTRDALLCGNDELDLGIDSAVLVKASSLVRWPVLLREQYTTREEITTALVRECLPSCELLGGDSALAEAIRRARALQRKRKDTRQAETSKRRHFVKCITREARRLEVALAELRTHLHDRAVASCLLVWDQTLCRVLCVSKIPLATVNRLLLETLSSRHGGHSGGRRSEWSLVESQVAGISITPYLFLRPSGGGDSMMLQLNRGCIKPLGFTSDDARVSLHGIFEIAAASSALRTVLPSPLQRLVLSYVGLLLRANVPRSNQPPARV